MQSDKSRLLTEHPSKIEKIYNKNYQSKENKKIFQVSRLLTAVGSCRSQCSSYKFYILEILSKKLKKIQPALTEHNNNQKIYRDFR